ncbi:MAG: 30S ribosomal protein S6 [Planctomycetota bacterium]|nr:30S ribosomal protein S6 [Planctomycetota bacterium]
MADNLYEGMFVLDSGKFTADSETATNNLIGMIEKTGGSVVTHRAWLDGKLAYPIEKHRKGLHYLMYVKMPATGVSEVARSCKLSDLVLRHMLIRHPQTLFDAMVNAVDSSGGSDEAEKTPAELAKEAILAAAAEALADVD